MTKVYIASPYTIGDTALNVRVQIDAVTKLMNYKFAPFAPLYSHFQQITHPRPAEDWMEVDFEWVATCDCLLRLPGKSDGADREEALARKLNKPVFYSIDKLLEHYGY